MHRDEINNLIYQLDNRMNYKYLIYDEKINRIGGNIDGINKNKEIEKTFKSGKDQVIEDRVYMILKYKEKIQYILYIDRKIDEVRDNIKLIKGFLELCIREERERNKGVVKDEIERSFFMELLAIGDLEYFEFIEQKAKLLNFDVTKKRRIILMDLIDFKKRIEYFEDSSDKVKNIIGSVRKVILGSLKMNEYCYNLFDDKFIIVKNYSTDKEIKKFLEEVVYEIGKKCKFEVISFVSDGCVDALDYSTQYRKLLRLHKMYAFKRIKPKKIIFVNEDEVEVFLRSYPKNKKEEVLQEYRKTLEKYSGKKEVLDTIEVFFKNDMDSLKTSVILGVHRNTVNYRVKKFIEDTGIDVSKAYECMKVYILLCLMKND